MDDDLSLIKKYYGENMMHLCRKLFPTILEKKGLLFHLIDSNFERSRFLYEDIYNQDMIMNFKNFIYGLIDRELEEKITELDPFELMKEVGYTLYKCESYADIQQFKKYYKSGEELCTFRDKRLASDYVFFAVKDNADKLNRDDFKNPDRQDEYGTSVISIQFTKGEVNTLSIKNRYNHTVDFCDSTFSNNLENIIEGLSNSFEKKYGYHINQNGGYGFCLGGYVKANDGKYYKYNYEINNKYYCPNNLIIDNFNLVDKYLEKEKYIVMDYFILDLVNKKISLYDNSVVDSFIYDLYNISKIEILNDKEKQEKNIDITLDSGKKLFIKLDKTNRIIGYKNDSLRVLKDNFMKKNIYLQKLETPNVIAIGNDVLLNNRFLESLRFPFAEYVNNNFLARNRILAEIYMPLVIKIGDNFLRYNNAIKEICFQYLLRVGHSFMYCNEVLEKGTFESLEEIGTYFFYDISDRDKIYAPRLSKFGYGFMRKSYMNKK